MKMIKKTKTTVNTFIWRTNYVTVPTRMNAHYQNLYSLYIAIFTARRHASAVSVCRRRVSVCLSHVDVILKRLNVG